MNHFVFGFLLGVALLPFSGSGQTRVGKTSERQQSVNVGDAELLLGMSKADVMGAFSKGYVLRENKTKGVDWLVFGDDDPKELLATLSFSQGRLSFVGKPWLRGGTRKSVGAIEMGNGVYGILANFADAGETHCSLKMSHDDTPDHSGKVARVLCGRRSLAILITTEPGEGEAADLQESLSTE